MTNIGQHKFQHIILISLDTLRNDCITALDSEFVRTYAPNPGFCTKALDNLVEKGMYFSNCISAAPYTSASHAAYFTGRWPRNNGVYEFFNRKLICPTIFEFAHKKKIHTVFQTDFPIILGNSLGFTRGVDKYVIEDENEAFDHLLKQKEQKSISFFHFAGIHYPYGYHKLKFAKEEYPSMVRHLEKLFNITPDLDQKDLLDESFRDSKDKQLLFRYKHIVDTLYARGDFDELHRLYLAGVNHFFTHRFNNFIKRVIDFVDNSNTLLIVFSDHGEHWAVDSRGHSNSIYDSVLRVPLIMYGNGVVHKKVNTLVRTIDVLPTISQYSDLDIGQVDGHALDIFHPDQISGERDAFAQVWRVGDRNKIYNHQQRIIEKNRMITPLRTMLEKEVVYSNGFALQRQYAGMGVTEQLFLNMGDRLIFTPYDKERVLSLRKLLVKYNEFRPIRDRRINTLADSVRNDLSALGYKV